MNAAEQIVDAYFRLVRGCFTLADRKVEKGAGRQLDILAYNLRDMSSYHVEVGVTHQKNWCPTVASLKGDFEKKFFGVPPNRNATDGRTDFEKKKSFWEAINQTYEEVGFETTKVRRVWVCWIIKDRADSSPYEYDFQSAHLESRGIDASFKIEVLSLRDYVIPRLQEKIGTANYDDVMLRTLGFMKQRELQSNVGPEPLAQF